MTRGERVAVSGLSLSAVGFVAILLQESFVPTAMIPTINDRPTIGYGSTFKEDGTPVKMGETITPPAATARALTHIQKDETGLKRCVRAPINQTEYDVLVDFSYQYGVARTCNSSMVRNINAYQYRAACHGYTLYKFSGGYDCSTLIDGKPNKRCWGVWTRNLERRDRCLSAQ